MPDETLRRLEGLNLSRMRAADMRNALAEARESLKAESAERADLAARAANLARDLDAAKARAEAAEARAAAPGGPAAASVDVETMAEAVARRLGDRGVATADAVSAQLKDRIGLLEAERAQLAARIDAQEKLIESLKQEGGRAETAARLDPQSLFGRFAADVDAAAEQTAESGFEIDDVQVDVRGALGLEGDRVVLGLDAARAPTPETATRLSFRLKRRASVRPVE